MRSRTASRSKPNGCLLLNPCIASGRSCVLTDKLNSAYKKYLPRVQSEFHSQINNYQKRFSEYPASTSSTPDPSIARSISRHEGLTSYRRYLAPFLRRPGLHTPALRLAPNPPFRKTFMTSNPIYPAPSTSPSCSATPPKPTVQIPAPHRPTMSSSKTLQTALAGSNSSPRLQVTAINPSSCSRSGS